MKKFQKIVSLSLALVLSLTIVACGNGNVDDTPDDGDTSVEEGNEPDGEEVVEGGVPTIDELVLGENYTDIEADLRVISHRTDLVDTKFPEYVAAFNELYPNINISYEGITDYAGDMTTRLTTSDWGSIAMIPTTVQKDELQNMFVSFGDLDTLSEEYVMLNDFAFEDQVYGIPSTGNAQGVVYNKQVFEEAGITEIPTTPEEFLDALQAIKDNTDAIPLYTNFAAEWTMSAWDAYITGSATGDPEFTNIGLVHGSNPFAENSEAPGTGPYAVYNVLYEAVARGLTEDDPTTTDWEGSKGMINRGEIGTMVLGSWAVVQMQEAGENADDIGYMSFPITVNGKQYATAGPDYNYGININATDDEKIASMLYIKWLTEKSNFSYDEGGIPIQVGAEYPDTLSAFEGVELVENVPAPAGEETYYEEINNGSELGLNADHSHVSEIVEAAVTGSETMDDIVADWNERWTAAQEDLGVEIDESYSYLD